MRSISLLISFTFLTTSLQSAATSPTLYLNDIKWPPYFFPSLENSQRGLAKEVLNLCISKMGYQITYKTLPIKRTHLYMRSGELDISVYSYLESRKRFVQYSTTPLFISEYGFASKKSDNISIEKIEDIKTLNFGHLAGLSHTEELNNMLAEMAKKNQVSTGHDLDAMFGQLLATPQRFQVMANSKSTLMWRARQLGLHDKIKIHPLVLKSKPYFLTVSKSTKNIKNVDKFIADFEHCLSDLKASDKFKQITAKYSIEY